MGFGRKVINFAPFNYVFRLIECFVVKFAMLTIVTAVPCRNISNTAVVLAVSPRDHYQQLVQDGTIDHDPHQIVVVNVLQQLHDQLNGYVPPAATPSLLKMVCVCMRMCVCMHAWVYASQCMCVHVRVCVCM